MERRLPAVGVRVSGTPDSPSAFRSCGRKGQGYILRVMLQPSGTHSDSPFNSEESHRPLSLQPQLRPAQPSWDGK